MTRPPRSAAGFTLVEAIMAIVITGILSAIVAVFIARPVEGYLSAVRRAELTDTADVAMRRLTRDIRMALPNSLRIRDSAAEGVCATGVCFIEFIMTSGGGRYRDPADGSTGGDFLSFTDSVDKTFDVLGPANPAIAAGDYIAVYNLGPGYNPANAYLRDSAQCDATPASPGCNIAQVSSIAGNVVTLDANPFAFQSPPLPSPSNRFQVVPGATRAVTYVCPLASGKLIRASNYGFNATQPTALGSNLALLATGASCSVEYTANATGRNGLLLIQLTLTASGGESVTLFQQIHVDNAP